MPRVLRFARCESCGHAAMAREGCAMCGAPTIAEEAPDALYAGWRCDCYHCVSTPC